MSILILSSLCCVLIVQMFIGDGAKMVRDAFALAKEKAPAIIFIDELDAIGTKVCVCVYVQCIYVSVCRDENKFVIAA